jgi:hypothetical protein
LRVPNLAARVDIPYSGKIQVMREEINAGLLSNLPLAVTMKAR